MSIITKFPIGQYVDGNKSWLRIIDSRLKLLILAIFLISPIWAGPFWRLSLMISLIFITFVSALPRRIWWRSFILLFALSLLVGFLSIMATSNISTLESPFRDPNELKVFLDNRSSWNIFEIPSYQFGFFHFGPFNVSRKAFEIGIKTSTLIFTVVHSVNLVLLTTLKEDMVWALSWFLNPLRKLGIPLDRLLFQLLLALRFIPLVQEELQNILKSISVRSINYRKLGLKKSFKVLLGLIERLFINILLRVEQGAESLLSKGSLEFTIRRFKYSDKQDKNTVLANLFSLIFLCLAIFLRKQYGSI
tara:strand:+ start:510 stop:1424 length:915 start_codon:yes stop_codon:yes gene_type:complete